MACDGRYAEAWEFVTFFCTESLFSRLHDGENNAAILTDTQAQFLNSGIRAGVGMVLYNVTDGSSGVVTEVTEHTLTATLAGGAENLWDVNDVYRIVTIDAVEIARAQNYLDLTAADVHAALSAQGGCDCALSSWGLGFLKKLNIVDAATFFTCSCMANLSAEERESLRNWMSAQLELIRTGKIDLCGSGSESPAFGIAEIAWTPFNAARIISNSAARGWG